MFIHHDNYCLSCWPENILTRGSKLWVCPEEFFSQCKAGLYTRSSVGARSESHDYYVLVKITYFFSLNMHEK